MGLSERPVNYLPQTTGGNQIVTVFDNNHHTLPHQHQHPHHHPHQHQHHHNDKDKLSNKKRMHLLKKIKKRFGLVRRSPSSSCPGPNNLPPLQFHSVHGDNIRISRDGTLARRFESFCRAITFSSRPVRINERVCVRFNEVSNNWNGGIRFGFTTNDPGTLDGNLPKYACPDLTNRPGFWAKALHEQYCEKDNVLFYYVNTAGEVVYGINNEEKGVILTGIDTRGLLWTIIDIYGNCTAIEFLDARVYMYQQSGGGGGGNAGGPGSAGSAGMSPISLTGNVDDSQTSTLCSQQHIPRRSLPIAATTTPTELERHIMPSMQSLNISMGVGQDQLDGGNILMPLRYNTNGRLIPVPFHITKGRNVRLSHDRFVASRTENDFCQGYVFTARPIRIGEKLIVQILKTEQMYVGALALGLTSCNPAALQPNDLPNDSDFLLDRPEYWVVSKDIAAAPQRGDEIAFFVAPNGEVTISKNNGPSIVVMHVDQSLQLWAFLDVYGSTQIVRMFRQQLPNMITYTPTISSSNPHIVNMTVSESLNSLNSQISETHKILPTSQHAQHVQHVQQVQHLTHAGTISASSSTLTSSMPSTASNLNVATNGNSNGIINGTCSPPSTANANGGRMISMPTNGGDMIQIQPNGGGTVLVVNLPPATSALDLNSALNATQLRGTANTTGTSTSINAIAATTNGLSNNTQFIETMHSNISNNTTASSTKWSNKDYSNNSQRNSATTACAECTICYENQIDSVLYSCGHMCMCYDCAIEQWRGVGGGHCPLCRAIIRDVIRTYTT